MPTDSDHAETNAAWQTHYARAKSRQAYPDENLVRLLAPPASERGPALDLGCGSGRHLALLRDLGYAPLTGIDQSSNSIDLSQAACPEARCFAYAESDPAAFRLDFPDDHFQVVVIWGVLHYNSAALAQRILAECARVLRPTGALLGTLRAEGDTHFQGNADIHTAAMQYFNEAGARDLLAHSFAQIELGYAERTPVGELERRVCHWLFRAAQAGQS